MRCMHPWCLCIQLVQGFIVPGGAGNILFKGGQRGGQGGMVEVARDEEESLWVLRLSTLKKKKVQHPGCCMALLSCVTRSR